MYQDRTEAGSQLAEILTNHNYGQIIILAIPRGGIVVAAPIAQRLEVPINVLITKKIGHPAHAEIAIGAVMPDGSAIIDAEAQNIFDEEYISQATIKAYQEIKRRLSVYQATETLPQLAGKTAIIIDDGIATGHTVKAAIKWLRTLKPAKVILAIPVAPPDIIAELSSQVEEIICPTQPKQLRAVGFYYHDFSPISEADALSILAEINQHNAIGQK